MAKRATSSFMLVLVALCGQRVCKRAGCRAFISRRLTAARRLAQERKSGQLSRPSAKDGEWGRGMTMASERQGAWLD